MTESQLKSKLEASFPGAVVEVVDLTGTRDHYQVYIQAREFAGLSRILQQKAVMQVLEAELKSGEVHALTMRTAVKSD